MISWFSFQKEYFLPLMCVLISIIHLGTSRYVGKVFEKNVLWRCLIWYRTRLDLVMLEVNNGLCTPFRQSYGKLLTKPLSIAKHFLLHKFSCSWADISLSSFFVKFGLTILLKTCYKLIITSQNMNRRLVYCFRINIPPSKCFRKLLSKMWRGFWMAQLWMG